VGHITSSDAWLSQTPVKLMSGIGKTYVRFLHISCILVSDRGHDSRNFDNEVRKAGYDTAPSLRGLESYRRPCSPNHRGPCPGWLLKLRRKHLIFGWVKGVFTLFRDI